MARRPVYQLFDASTATSPASNLATAVVGIQTTDVALWSARLHAIADELDRLGRLADSVETGPPEPYGGDDEDWIEG